MNPSFSIISTLVETAKLARRYARLFLVLTVIGSILPFAIQWIAAGMVAPQIPDHPKPEDLSKVGSAVAFGFLSFVASIFQLVIGVAIQAAILGTLKTAATGSGQWPAIKSSLRRYTWPLVILAFLLGIIAIVITVPFTFLILAISSPSNHNEATPYIAAFLSMLVAVLYFVFAKYALADPLVVVEDLNPLAALRRSWQMTRGRFGYVVGCYIFVGTGEYLLIMLFQYLESPSAISWLNGVDAILNSALGSYWTFLAWVMYIRIKSTGAQAGEPVTEIAPA